MVRRVAAVIEQCWHRVPGGTATSTIRSLGAIERSGKFRVMGLAARHSAPAPIEDQIEFPVVASRLPRFALYESWHRFRRPALRPMIGDVDVVHATGGVIPPAGRRPLAVTVHDLAFLRTPQHFTERGVRFMTRSFEIARDEAAAIIVPSRQTADDCLAHGIEQARLRVVPWGVYVAAVSESDRARVKHAYNLPRQFALWVGTAEPRKNLRGLLDAHRLVQDRLPLVMAGPVGWGADQAEVLASAAPSARHIGRVAEPDLAVLYDLATVFVYPSLWEGFGMPVLEAMAQATPVISTRDSPMDDVAGEAGVMIDATDTEALSEALLSVVSDPDPWLIRSQSARRRAESATWDRTGHAIVDVYGEICR